MLYPSSAYCLLPKSYQYVPGAQATGRGRNQVGAGKTETKVRRKRKHVMTSEDEGVGAAGPPEQPKMETPQARGLCFGSGVAAKIRDSINVETGCVKEGVALCNDPNFREPGATLGKSTWQVDGNACLVLGYHNTKKSAEHPTCMVGGTAPLDETRPEEGFHAAKWALRFIRTGDLIMRSTNNVRHNGAAERARKKRG